VDVLDGVGGYRSDLIAGEEPELCVRLRAKGWKIWRLADEMALHDAAMTRFGQWWKRCVRAGHAFAEGAFLHGRTPERFCVRESRRARVWGIAIPAAVLVTTMQFGAWGLVLLGIYPLQILRLSSRGKRRLLENLLWAAFNVLGKFPELVGQLNFHRNRFARGSARLIEYK
jgi:hypothetical protein